MLGCHEPKRNYPIPSESDINEIVKAIVAKDSLFNRAVPLYIKLRKIKTIKTIDNIPPPFGDLSIGVLTHLQNTDLMPKMQNTYFFKMTP